MKRSLLLTALLVAALIAAPGCKRKQPPQSTPPRNAQPAGSGMQWMPPGHPEAGAERKVVISDDVRNYWKAVRIEVLYKEKKEKKQFDVPLDTDFQIPGANLTLKAGPFLPDFQMGPEQITSASNKPQNPVVRAEVLEEGRKIFSGWLFAKYPDIHSFTHDKYGVTLVEGIQK